MSALRTPRLLVCVRRSGGENDASVLSCVCGPRDGEHSVDVPRQPCPVCMPPIGLLCVRLSCVHVLSIFCTLHTIYRCTCRTLTRKRLKTAIAMLPLTAPNLSCIARMATGAALFRVHSMHKWSRQMGSCSNCVLGTLRQLLAALASHLQMWSSNADTGYMRQYRLGDTAIEA